MQDNDDQQKLLLEIRNILTEQLEEYRKVTSQSLECQRLAVQRQEHYGRLYKFALVCLAFLIIYWIWFSTTLSHP